MNLPVLKQLTRLCLVPALLVLLTTTVQAGELVIITASDNTESLDLNDVARIFLGKVTQFPSGQEVVPLNMDPSDPSFEQFARAVLKKTPSQLKAYWAKRVFTGKGKPPQTFKTAEEIIDLVASDKRYLSYVDKDLVDHRVRWVTVLEE